MNSNFFTLTLLFSVICLLSSCKKEVLLNSTPLRGANIYSFTRNGEETAIYNGQIVRHILIKDFKLLIEQLASPSAQPISAEYLYQYYDNGGVTIPYTTLIKTQLPLIFPRASDIAGNRDLRSKATKRYEEELTTNIKYWCKIIANNSQDPDKLGTYRVYINETTGHDLQEFLYLSFLGGINYNHGLKAYLIGVDNKENDELFLIDSNPAPYTQMEHHFDEAFGYTGAARNFTDFNLRDIAGIEGGFVYKDNFEQDGKINFKSEFNFDFILEAARRDVASQVPTNYAESLFLSFYRGRISIINQEYDKLLVHKHSIEALWEEIIAATAIHHLNSTLAAIEQLENKPNIAIPRLYQHWSAMYKYTEMLRYNYKNRLTEWKSILQEFYITLTVSYPKILVERESYRESYQKRLIEAREIFLETYPFARLNVEHW